MSSKKCLGGNRKASRLHSLTSLILVGVLLASCFLVVGSLRDMGMSVKANTKYSEFMSLDLAYSPAGDEFKLSAGESQTWTATVGNGSAPFMFVWSLFPSANFTLNVNGESVGLVRGRAFSVAGESLQLCFPVASEDYVNVGLTCTDSEGITTSLLDTFLVRDPYTQPDLYLEASVAPYTCMVTYDGLGWFQVVNGTAGGLIVDDYTGTDANATVNYALGNCSVGSTVIIGAGNFTGAAAVVPDGVKLEINRGATGLTYSAAASATCAVVDWQNGFIDYYVAGAQTAYINFTSGAASFSPTASWDGSWNATVEEVVDAFSDMAWKSGWNATVESIVASEFLTQNWNSDWNTTITDIIAGASIVWSKITNANTTVQQIVDAYSSMAWKDGWNATVADIAASSVSLESLASLIVTGTGTFGNLTLSSGYFPTDVDYIVYPEGANYVAKHADGSVDFVSTNASYVIQSACNALVNTYNLNTEATLAQDTGTVYVAAGNYTIDAPITVDKRVHLMGSKSGQTWFVASANLSPGMFIVNASNLRFQDWGIENVAIDMVTYDGDGIYSANAGSSGARCVGFVEDVVIYNVQAGYTGIELTNAFHVTMRQIRVYSAGTCVKFLQSGSVIYGNSVFEDWMLWALGDGAVGLNVTNGASYAAVNLCTFNRVQIQGTASNSDTYGVWWDGNGFMTSVIFIALNIERMEVGMYIDAIKYMTLLEPYIWTDENNADNRGVVLIGNTREFKCLGGLIAVGANADSKAWDDQSTSSSYKHLLQNAFLETNWGSFGTMTRLENVDCYRIGAGVTRQNEYNGAAANNTSTATITFDHGCFYNPNILQCSFSSGVITGYTWTTTVSTVTLTVYTSAALPEAWTVYFQAEYDPTYGDPS